MDVLTHVASICGGTEGPYQIKMQMVKIVENLDKIKLTSKEAVSSYIKQCAFLIQYEVKMRLSIYNRVPTAEEFDAVFEGYSIFKQILEDTGVDIYDKYSEALEDLLLNKPLDSYYREKIMKLVS